MKIAKALQARPWTLASLASARPYASLQMLKEAEKAEFMENMCTPYGNQSRGNSYTEGVPQTVQGVPQTLQGVPQTLQGVPQTLQGIYPTPLNPRDLLCKLREEALSKLVGDSTAWHFRPPAAYKDHESDQRQGMGSFTSSPVLASGDSQDDDLHFPECSEADLLDRCRQELAGLPPPLDRRFRRYSFQHTPSEEKEVDKLNIRVLQWNHLSQTLGTKNDKFVRCPPDALEWSTRRFRLLQEILRYQPDVVCLQEVDHFNLLNRALGSIGYTGRFVPKPDSPCIYLADNNGPDGCAIFVKNKFEIVSESKRILEVWRVQSNQVVLCLHLRHKETGREVAVATTHLKARQGALLSTLRNEQGKDMLDWLADHVEGRPLVLSGDFNADPSEPVYQSVTNHGSLHLSSAYRLDGPEDYTTWKIRETGEQKYILDYIFHTHALRPEAVLEMPTEEEVGEDRLPSLRFPSDHLSLVADFSLTS